MGRKSKKAIARIVALLMAFMLLPFDLWETSNVVIAEELSEAYTEEAAIVEDDAVAVEDVTDAEDEKTDDAVVDDATDEEEISSDAAVTEEMTNTESVEDSALASEVETSEETKEVEEEKKEEEKPSTETVNKGTATKIHNFTGEDGKYNGTPSDTYFTVTGSEKKDATKVTYNNLDLTCALKIDSKANVKFTTKTPAELEFVYVLKDTSVSHPKVDGTVIGENVYTQDANNSLAYVAKMSLSDAKEHTIERGTKGELYLYYIAVTEQTKDQVATPTATPAPSAGTIKVGETIKLSCDPADAVIYYTTDGSDPKPENAYSNGITITSGMVSDGKATIKAYATKEGYEDSAIGSFEYTVSTELGENQLQMPTADPDSGEVAKGTKVALKPSENETETNVSIYYTTDGTTPNKIDGTLYKDPIEINEDTTIKAIAIKDGKDDSFVAVFEYTIKKATISFDENFIAVEPVGDISFKNQDGKEVFDVKLTAEKVAAPAANIRQAAERYKQDNGEILYYDFKLVNQEDAADTVSVSIPDGKEGSLNITMPYSIKDGTSKRNEIIVLHNTDKLEVAKESDGFSFSADSFSPYTVIINPAAALQLSITKSAGYEEGAYAEWKPVDGADGYMAYVAAAGGKFERIDDELIREYSDHWRVDTVGLAKGNYYIKIDAVTLETTGSKTTATVIATDTTDALKVTNYDRSGFAFSSTSNTVAGVSSFGTASGAYNDDGTLKEGAQVIYVTADTAKTCTAMLHTAGLKKDPVKVTGLQAILDGKQKKDTEQDILDIRIIGCVTRNDLDGISSSEEGLQIKGNKDYNEMNITLEGIGEDAAVKDFGFLLRNCCNVELRNFAVMAFMDDGVSLDTSNKNIWVHDLDIFYGATGGDADQAKGDGSVDVKAKSTFVTVAYNHFWDSGKCSLCGMSDSEEFAVTYHHNWFDHSDSRHPRIRVGSIHIYNNYFDGNSKYGVGVTKGSSAFVEANYFRNCKYPMLISQQGSDLAGDGKGTFSGEDGGIIKAYNNVITGATGLVYANAKNGSTEANATAFDAYLASVRNEKVPANYKTAKGGTNYNNFDTDYDLGVKEENIDTPQNVPTVVTAKAGRLNGGDFKWDFSAAEDENYSVIKELKDKVVNYKTSVKTVGSNVAKDVEVVEGDDSNAPSEDSQKVSAPTANKPSGEVEKGTEITLSAADGAEIRYTLTGLDPTKDSERYTTPIVINADTTIKAIAVSGTKESSVATFRYTIAGDPTVNPDPGPGPNPPSGDDQSTTKMYEFNPEKDKMSDHTMPEEGTYGTNGYFTIGNADSKSKIAPKSTKGNKTPAPNPSKSSVTEYSVRYQFGGTAATKDDPKAIRFENKNKAKVYVAAYRINEKERNLYLDSDNNVEILSNTVKEYTFDNVEAGTHGIYAKDGDIAILYVIVEEFVPSESGDDVTVEAPTAKPVSGTKFPVGGGTVELESATDGAKIYYTNDGTTPTTASTEYTSTSPIVVDKTMTIMAIAVVNGKSSSVSTFEYTVSTESSGDDTTVNPPTATPAAETYDKGTKVSLSADAGADIYYTTDGSEPTTSSNKYTSTTEIVLNDDMTIKAIAVVNGKSSVVATFEYKVRQDIPPVEEQVSKPEANYPTGTTVQKGTTITLTSIPKDAKIYYTLDGSTPTAESTLYKEQEPIEISEDTTIKAIAIKEGYKDSEVATYEYTVAKDEEVKQVAVPKANIASGTSVQKGTTITLTADPSDAEIRYTLNGTTPTENSTLYTKPIEIHADTTIKAFAAKQGYISSAVITFVYTVIEDDPTIPEGSGLRVVLKNKETYTYTGSAIKPEILVYNNRDRLIEGVDYTVQYKNNVNASKDAKNKPLIIVRGKKDLAGSASTTFEIEKKDLSDSSKGAGAVAVSGITSDGELLVMENTKASPTLYYGGVKLSNNYFSISKTGKFTLGDTGSEIVISGKGNFAGELRYKVKVINRSSLKKFTVSFTNPNYIYNGQSQIFELAEGDVKDVSNTETKGVSLKKDIDYTVVYQKDTTNAGNVKFTVVGLGYYTGSITKSYTIRPKAVTSGMKITGVSGRPYPYASTGVTIANVKVSYNDIPLEEGKDYKLVYSGNKKVGTAKLTVSFMGNYKGSNSISKFFTIGTNALTNDTAGLKVAVADMIYKKPGVYKAIPYVSVNGIEIKASNFIVRYYLDEALEKEVSGRNKIVLSDKDTYKTVYMKITGKDRGNYQGTELTASFKVCKQASSAIYDLSRAKLIVYTDWSPSALRVNKMEHTGNAVEPGVAIQIGQGLLLTPKEVKQLIDSGKLKIHYVNNVNKGRATIVINGDGETYAGSQKVGFSITTKNIKNTSILDNLFTTAVKNYNVQYLLQNP